MATKYTYTDTEIQEISQKYLLGETLEALADTYQKSVQSIRMKLVKLGVYQSKAAKKPSSTTTKTQADPKPKLTAKQAAKANRDLFDLMLFQYGPAPF